MTQATGYLPMNCPVCGRRRLLPTILAAGDRAWVTAVACEKCETAWPSEGAETGGEE